MRRRHWRVLFGALVLVAAAGLAGCSGLGGPDSDSDPGADGDTERPPRAEPAPDPDQLALESITAGLDTEQTAAFRAAISAEGRLTDRGERLVAGLAELAPASRRAAARAVADRGAVTETTLAAIERVQAAPPAFQQAVFAGGLADTTGGGVLDGERLALGFDPDGYKPRVDELLRPLGGDGYSEHDLAYLRAVGNLSWVEWRQAEQLGLLHDAVADGSVPQATVPMLRDGSGDGLVNGTAGALGLNKSARHEGVAELVVSLGFNGITATEWQYLDRAAARSQTPFAWTQAETFVYRDVADGQITESERGRLADTSGDGLLDGFIERLGADPTRSHDRLRPYAEELAMPFELYTFNDLRYLGRLARLSTDEQLWAQATSFGLLGQDPIRRGFVTLADRQELRTVAPGVLNATAAAVGLTERPAATETVQTLLASLAEGPADSYTPTETAYLERVVELSQYRGHEYERWAQAEQLGLLERAAATGTITDDELWALQNNDSDRLLNGIERAFGTDPTAADTSGDGFADHLVWGPMRDLGLAPSPTQPNVYVEVEATQDAPVPTAELRSIQQLFAEEPATTGPINLQFYTGRTNRTAVETAAGMTDRERTSLVDGYGFHYLLFQDQPLYGSEGRTIAGLTRASFPERPEPRSTWMTVVADLGVHGTTDGRAASTAHELGHMLGIRGYHFDGVDSFRIPAGTYTSVMSYHVTDRLTFSTGPPFNDYERMAESAFGSYDLDTSRLKTVWAAGERPEEPLVDRLAVDRATNETAAASTAGSAPDEDPSTTVETDPGARIETDTNTATTTTQEQEADP